MPRRHRDAEPTKLPPQTMACRILGHRWTFALSGTDMVWVCDRGCGEGGRRHYASRDEARFYAARLNRQRPGPPPTLLRLMAGVFARRGDDQPSGRRRDG